MALATQCPHCGTTFRVAQDQLKLRAGLVRCGACKQVFNGVEHLLRPSAAGNAPAAVAPLSPSPTSTPSTAATVLTATPPAFIAPVPLTAAVPDPTQPPTPVNDARTAADGSPADIGSEQPEVGGMRDPSMPDDEKARFADINFDVAARLIAEASFDVRPDAMQDGATEQVSARPAASAASHFKAPEPDQNDPLLRMTLMDFTDPDEIANPEAFGDTRIGRSAFDSGFDADPAAQNDVANANQDDGQDELSRAIDDLQSKPWHAKSRRGWRARQKNVAVEAESEADSYADELEPGFVRRARRQQRLGRPLQILMTLAIILLMLGAVLQGMYAFRDQIAARFPLIVPALTQLCTVLDCQVGLPMKIEALSIESSELQAVAPTQNSFALLALLRNRSNTVQAWPHIELTLNDANEQAIARRIFSPRDYLGLAQNASTGLAADSEQAVKVSFELSQLKASGYRVYLFYP